MSYTDNIIAANIRRAIAAHARPLPAYAASGIDVRFANGNSPDGWHVADGAEVRPGQYRVYARRMSIVLLDQRFKQPVKPFWNPGVFFLPDDERMKPELVYDGNPLDRDARPVFLDAPGSKRKIQDRVFAHVGPAFVALAKFRERTGQRYEVLYMRERDRCLRTGDSFDWLEYPVDPSTLS